MLSKEEVIKILPSVITIKHKAILMITYPVGLRAGEVILLGRPRGKFRVPTGHIAVCSTKNSTYGDVF